MNGGEGGAVLSNRQRRLKEKRELRELNKTQLRQRDKELRARRAAAEQVVRPAPEAFVPAVAKHEDDRVIPGLTGKGAIQRLDTLGKLWESGKITPQQYSAGRDYLAIVEHYFACASGLAKLSEEAGRVGGAGDPITRYLKGRPARTQPDGTISGYIPTQRPRNPSYSRPSSDGWNGQKLAALTEFSRMAKLVERLDREPRKALSILVIDAARPDLPALSVGAACRRIFGSDRGRNYAILTRWLCVALDELDGELSSRARIAA
jgi:hypothetical protein